MKIKIRYLLMTAIAIIVIAIYFFGTFSDWRAKNAFISYASERYNVPQKDITVLSFTAKEKRIQLGAPIPTPYWSYTPARITLQVGDMTLKLTTAGYDSDEICDDYCFDETIQFCAEQLDVEEVLLCPSTSGITASIGVKTNIYDIAGFLEGRPITEVDDSVVIQFLTLSRGTPGYQLLIPTDSIPTENDIKRVIDHLVQIDDESKKFFTSRTTMSISFVDSIENIVITRKAQDDGFDALHFMGHDDVHTYCTIYSGEKGNKKGVEEYNGYCYSNIKEPADETPYTE